MTVNRRPSDRFQKESKQKADTSARGQLDLILSNQSALLSLRGGDKSLRDALEYDRRLRTGQPLTWEYQAIENIYEKTWKALGYGSVDAHHDRPRANLRHPR
jgi:hypothetical protein